MPIPREPGMYIVTLKNSEPISVNAHDSRVAEKAIKVTKENCKVGKAKNIAVRARNYAKTFGEDNVNFHPVAVTDAYQKVERLVLKELDRYRLRGRRGGRTSGCTALRRRMPLECFDVPLSTQKKTTGS